MKLEIYGKGKTVINNVDDWCKFAPPKHKAHWKEGRSAMELARYFEQNKQTLPTEIENVLKKLNIRSNDDFECFPERVTRFDGCKGEGRNHDALLVSQSIVVGIEAKADESFGKYVSTKDISDNKKKRIEQLAQNIFGDSNYDLSCIKYQLLTATAGTLCEAKEAKVDKALLLIITFKKEGCYNDKKTKTNSNDIDIYIEALKNRYQTSSPFRLAGYSDIDLYIEHLEIFLD